MIRSAIIGCGRIAWEWDVAGGGDCNTHAKAYSLTPGVLLAACADIKLKKAKGLAAHYPGTTVYKDYKEMLAKERLDVVSICTPPATHYRILKYILEKTRVRYILCEKPMGVSPVQARHILRLARQKRAYVAINYLRRWDKTLNDLRGFLTTGRAGKLKLSSSVYYGGIEENCIHFIDFFDFIGYPLSFGRFLAPHRGSFVMKAKGGAEVFFHRVDRSRYACLYMDLFFEKARVRIGDYSDVEIFVARSSPVYQGFRELFVFKKMRATVCSAMLHSVRDITSLCRRKIVKYGFLEREIGYMKLIERIRAR